MPRIGRTRLFFIIAIIIGLALSNGTPARAAAAVDAAGAAHLKTVFTDLLNQKAAQTKAGGTKLVQDGQLMVEPSGTYYAITLPKLSTVAADGSRLDIGMISINVMPQDKPEEWVMTVALPATIKWFDAQGAEKASISIGKQNCTGLWNEKSESFLKLDAKYRDIKLDTPGKEFLASIPEASFIIDLKPDSSGNWSGPGRFTAENIAVAASGGGAVSIGKLESETDIQGYALDKASAYRDKMTAATSKMTAGIMGGTDADKTGLYDLITSIIGDVWDGATIKVGIENIVATQSPPGGAAGSKFSLGSAGVDLAFKDMRKDRIGAQAGLHYSGFAMQPASETTKLVPDQLNFVVSTENVPYKKLVEYGRTQITASAPAKQTSLAQIMQDAGMTITLQDFSLGNGVYNYSSNGVLNSDAKAVESFVGKMHAEITGLEALGAMLMKDIQDPKVPDAEKANLQQAVATMTILQMVGQQGAGKNGQPARIYNLELTESGQKLVNGTDLNTILGGGGQPAAGAPGQTAPAQAPPAPSATP